MTIVGKSRDCCRHCRKGCDGLGEIDQLNHQDEAHTCEWYDNGCPFCAEAERVAKWCEAQASRVLSERSTYYDDRGDRAAIYEYVAESARGGA